MGGARSPLHIVGISLLGVALVLGILVQFLPWRDLDMSASFGGNSVDMTINENLWGVDAHATCSGSVCPQGGFVDGQGSYWDSDFDDADPMLARLGGILVAIGLAALFASGIAFLANKPKLTGTLGLASGGWLLVASILFLVGLSNLGGPGDENPSLPGFSPAIATFLAFSMVGIAIGGASLLFTKAPAPAATLPAYGNASPYGRPPLPPGTRAPLPARPPGARPAYATATQGRGTLQTQMRAPGAAGAGAAAGQARRTPCRKCGFSMLVPPGRRPACQRCGYTG